jgi:hypothetical protein
MAKSRSIMIFKNIREKGQSFNTNHRYTVCILVFYHLSTWYERIAYNKNVF